MKKAIILDVSHVSLGSEKEMNRNTNVIRELPGNHRPAAP